MPINQGAAAAAVSARRTTSAPNVESHVTIISKRHTQLGNTPAPEIQNKAVSKKSDTLYYQSRVKNFYDRKSIQLFVAALILLNFVISGIQAQYLPVPGKDDQAISIFNAFEYFFAYAFTVELVVNFYGSYFWAFWKSWWNIFDFLIVVISLLSLYMKDLPGISVLRLFRAFRVVRLFKRIKTMRMMMDSIMSSLPGMSIAFAALFLIMGIYGIIGVEFWQHSHPDYFGNFLKAVLSLLQIMTFDSWCSGIARDIIFEKGAVAAIFFITYVFIASIIMANVLIALLLDEFMNNPEKNKNNAPQSHSEPQERQFANELLEEVKNNDAFGMRGFSNTVANMKLGNPAAFGQVNPMKMQSTRVKNQTNEMTQYVNNYETGDSRPAKGDLFENECRPSNQLPVSNVEMQSLETSSVIEQKNDSSSKDGEGTKRKMCETRIYNHNEASQVVGEDQADRTKRKSFSYTPPEDKQNNWNHGNRSESTARNVVMQEWMSRVDKGVNILAQSLADLNKKLELLSSTPNLLPEEDGASRELGRSTGKHSNDSSVKLVKRSARTPITPEHYLVIQR